MSHNIRAKLRRSAQRLKKRKDTQREQTQLAQRLSFESKHQETDDALLEEKLQQRLFNEVVNTLTNHERSLWGKAGYPGLHERDVILVGEFITHVV